MANECKSNAFDTINVTQQVLNGLDELYCLQQKQLKSELHRKWQQWIEIIKIDPNDAFCLFCVYYHLRLKKWKIGCGTKYGAHFLLYPQCKESEQRIHSKYLVLHNFNINDRLRLHSYIRLCQNIKKELILTSLSISISMRITNDNLSLCFDKVDETKLNILNVYQI